MYLYSHLQQTQLFDLLICTFFSNVLQGRCKCEGSLPQDVTVVELEQHVVLPELGLSGAVDAACVQVLVHLLQTLQTLGHVLVVNLGVKGRHVLLAELVGAVHVETSALLDQSHRVGATQVLLGNVLEEERKTDVNSYTAAVH